MDPVPWVLSPAGLFLMYQCTENTYVADFPWMFGVLMYVTHGFTLRYFLTVFFYGLLTNFFYGLLTYFLTVFLRIVVIFLRIISVFPLRIINACHKLTYCLRVSVGHGFFV